MGVLMLLCHLSARTFSSECVCCVCVRTGIPLLPQTCDISHLISHLASLADHGRRIVISLVAGGMAKARRVLKSAGLPCEHLEMCMGSEARP